MIRMVHPSYWLTLAASVVAASMLVGCQQGAEGDRCNPDLVNTTECNSGLSCVQPPTCVVNVCCPSSPPYTDPQCECIAHPETCASYDAGGCNVDAAYDGMPTTSSTDAGTVDAGSDASGASKDSGKDGAHG